MAREEEVESGGHENGGHFGELQSTENQKASGNSLIQELNSSCSASEGGRVVRETTSDGGRECDEECEDSDVPPLI